MLELQSAENRRWPHDRLMTDVREFTPPPGASFYVSLTLSRRLPRLLNVFYSLGFTCDRFLPISVSERKVV